ncbi:MAG TPA: hypothetical protein VJY86_01695 [Bacilli bacterium]|jgi:hypothetical protein|nr:hypothetical protein [Bacilli bacterium]
MRYTKEFKLECIRKYKNGIRINDALDKEVEMKRKKPVWTWRDKMAMIQRVLYGNSIQSVAFSNDIQAASFLSGSKYIKNMVLMVKN